MHKLTFYPLGNADSTRIDLADSRQMLVDFGDKGSDRSVDLAAELRKDLKARGRTAYAIVAFTHLDDDHCQGAADFFHFEHSSALQGGERIGIEELWVPAAVVTEDLEPDTDKSAIQKEARHRLKKGTGVRVFSRPERLAEWLESQGLTLESRKDLITDAGQTVPEYDLDGPEAVEFFIHSPHATRSDANEIEDRNGDSLVFQARFRDGAQDTDALFAGDINHEVWQEIVDITIERGRHLAPHLRLHWDVYKLPHHCSYTAIGPEKCTRLSPNKTPPVEQVRVLCEEHAGSRCIVVSPSKPIPAKGTKEDEDVQPPHREAAAYYTEDVVTPKDGKFIVTMNHPKGASQPKPVVVEIGAYGAKHVIPGAAALGASGVTSAASPRAG